MRWMPVVALVFVVVAACEKSSDRGSGDDEARGHADLEDGAVALIEAVLAGDEETARRLLVSPEQCPELLKMAPARDPAECTAFLEMMLASLDGWRRELREDGFQPGTASEKKVEPPAPPEAREVAVVPEGGGKPLEIGAVALDGRYYFILPMGKVEVD